VFRGPEREVLLALDEHLATLPLGVLVTWNGSGFDLPFLADRARMLRIRLALRLRPDAELPHKHEPIRGHALPYRARWHHYGHLDACCLYRTIVPEGTSCSLKGLARAAGLPVVEVDASSIHTVGQHELDRYVASDAWLARELATQAWSEAGSILDAA
jgi:DNA polymerase elongation subunit (family B)